MKQYTHLRNLSQHQNFTKIFNHHDFYITSLLLELFRNKTDEDIEIIEQKYNLFLDEYLNKHNIPFNIMDYSILQDEFANWIYQGQYLTADEFTDLQTFAVVKTLYNFIHHEFNQLDKINALQKFACLTNLMLECFGMYVDTQSREDEQICITEMEKQVRSDVARKAGKCKRSPYEKYGTIQAVNKLIDEKQDLLQQHGGKATLCRMILDLIAENQIPAPNTPTQKTVETWIDNYRKQKSTS